MHATVARRPTAKRHLDKVLQAHVVDAFGGQDHVGSLTHMERDQQRNSGHDHPAGQGGRIQAARRAVGRPYLGSNVENWCFKKWCSSHRLEDELDALLHDVLLTVANRLQLGRVRDQNLHAVAFIAPFRACTEWTKEGMHWWGTIE